MLNLGLSAIAEGSKSFRRGTNYSFFGALRKSNLKLWPTDSKALIGTLIAVWLGIGTYTLCGAVKKKKKQ